MHEENGLDVAALEVKLQALRAPPNAAKTITVGQAKHAATDLEQQRRRQCDVVVAAQENLGLQEGKMDELALKLAEACAVRDVLIVQEYRANVGKAIVEPATSQLHVGKCLAGEQIKLVYEQLFDPSDPSLDHDDLEFLRNFEATTQAGIQTQFLTHFQTFQATMAAEAAKVQAEASARAAKRKRANKDEEDAKGADAANQNLLLPAALPPTHIVGSEPPPDNPTPTTAAPAAAADQGTPQSSGSQDGGGAGATGCHAAETEAHGTRNLPRRKEKTRRRCRCRCRGEEEARAHRCNRSIVRIFAG